MQITETGVLGYSEASLTLITRHTASHLEHKTF